MKKLTFLFWIPLCCLLKSPLSAQVINDDKINYYALIYNLWTADQESGADEPGWKMLWQLNQVYDLPCNDAAYANGWCQIFDAEGTYTINQELASGTDRPSTDYVGYTYLNWENDDVFSNDCEMDSDDDNGNCGTQILELKSGSPCQLKTNTHYGFNDWCRVETLQAWRYTNGEDGYNPLIFGVVNNETKTHLNSNRIGPLPYTGYVNLWSDASLGFQTSPDVTYGFQLLETQQVTISTDSEETNYDTYIHLLNTGPNYDGSFSYNAGNDDITPSINNKSEIVKTLDPGYYYIVVEGYQELTGDFNLSITAITPPPANDEPCNAVSIPANGTVQNGYTNSGASATMEEQQIAPTGVSCYSSWCGDDLGVQNSVWFKFVAPPGGHVEVSTCGLADFDTQIALYAVSDCSNFQTYSLIQANDDGPFSCSTGYDSWMDVPGLIPGAIYYVLVDGYDGDSGAFGIYVKEIMTTATAEIDGVQLSITAIPNPSNGRFQVQIEHLSGQAELQVVDLNGGVLFTKLVEKGSSSTEVSMPDLPAGVYLLCLKTEKGYLTEKLMID